MNKNKIEKAKGLLRKVFYDILQMRGDVKKGNYKWNYNIDTVVSYVTEKGEYKTITTDEIVKAFIKKQRLVKLYELNKKFPI